MTEKEYIAEANEWLDHIKMLANKQKDDELYRLRLNVLEWLIAQAEKGVTD